MPTAPRDSAAADIGLVFALPLEVEPLLSRLERKRKYSGGDFTFHGGLFDHVRIVAVVSGTGVARATRATQALLEAHSPKWVLSCGLCGGLTEAVHLGDILLARTVLGPDGRTYEIDFQIDEPLPAGLHRGGLATVDHVVRTTQDKQHLHEATRALCVDMESSAVAAVATAAGLPFMAIRCVSDDVSADLPPEVMSLYAETGLRRLGAAAASLWQRPGAAKELWHLRSQAANAAERLTAFLEGVFPQLCPASGKA